jgi:hypothetical protein
VNGDHTDDRPVRPRTVARITHRACTCSACGGLSPRYSHTRRDRSPT